MSSINGCNNWAKDMALGAPRVDATGQRKIYTYRSKERKNKHFFGRSGSNSLAGGSANTRPIGKYVASVVAIVHPQQVHAKSSNSYYKSPTTHSSVSTPFSASQTAAIAPAAHLNIPTSASTHLRSQPTDWTIEEVIQYIESNENSLAVHGDLFRKHEIDGKALLLLNWEMMMKYMGLKLGPALKICNLVNKLNGRRNNLAL